MAEREHLDPYNSMWDWISFDLRSWRDAHGLSLTQLGKIMGVDRTTVSNMEAGRRRLQEHHAKTLDRVWETNGHFGRLHHWARSGHDPDWYRQHTDLESRATLLRIFELSVVPGLLQTPDYARALLLAAPSGDVDAGVNARLARQRTLSKTEPPSLWVILDQSVIDRWVGGPEVMRGQLEHLLQLADLPNVVLRVVSRQAGAHLGLEGAFKIMTVNRAETVYTEASEGGRLIRDPAEVDTFRTRFDLIGAKALPEHMSALLIKEVMEDLK